MQVVLQQMQINRAAVLEVLDRFRSLGADSIYVVSDRNWAFFGKQVALLFNCKTFALNIKSTY